MKDIKEYITEAVKFDYWKDVIEYVDVDDVRVPKKYIKPVDTKYYRKDFLEKYFGWINQWLDKNAKKIAQEVTKDSNKELPEEIWIKLPSKLNGKLCLEWDAYWRDGKPSGKLTSVEIDVNHVSSLPGGEFYDALHDLQKFKLVNQINF